VSEFIELVRDWRLFIAVLLVFGVAPDLVLRLVLLAYPKGHPRREELVGELYAMTIAARPMWVAQQFETAVFDGNRSSELEQTH
jgi:hypothetical protein